MAEISTGQRIRELRQHRGIAQSLLAEQVDISPSYLNLIEKDKRKIGGALLHRLAQRLEVSPAQLSGVEDASLVRDLVDIARVLSFDGLDEAIAGRLVAQAPDWGQAMVTLFQRYKDASETATALSDRLSQDPQLRELSHAVLTQISSIRSFAEILKDVPDLPQDERAHFSGIIASQADRLGLSAREMIALLEGNPGDEIERSQAASAVHEVEDLVNAQRNHLPHFETAADDLRRRILAAHGEGSITAAMLAHLETKHDVEVRQVEGDAFEGLVEEGVHLVDLAAPRTATRFDIARRLMAMELREEIEELARNDRLSGEDARQVARRAFANYAAGALLFPYVPFLEAAEHYRYDMDRLAQRFDGSFEQIAHRLTTLRRPGAEGIPFAYLRSDPAGNISKPYSLPGLRMPRLGGACPLWAVYAAFAEPHKTVAQFAAMPTGERFLFVARRVAKGAQAAGAAPAAYSIMLACEASYANRLVYGDPFTGGREATVTPVGFTCRTCSRQNCGQRAQAGILQRA
ncbi:MAG: short-chain fatty acyl-CoA regulator family protein [Alphaproteobacteria bacterium]|nr:short-chain fatty acyl-CoA regulator family protein [Alphaproteobacteria bacterium]